MDSQSHWHGVRVYHVFGGACSSHGADHSPSPTVRLSHARLRLSFRLARSANTSARGE